MDFKMNKPRKNDLPGIAYITATIVGVLLFMLFGESLTSVKPDPLWIAGLTGILFALGILWIWLQR
jgi:lipopolysaccharide export LptBFGC system permease protein LptF